MRDFELSECMVAREILAVESKGEMRVKGVEK